MRVLLLAVAAMLLAGCQVRVATDVTVDQEGGGQATVTVVVDDELRDDLVAAGIDLRDGLEEAAAGASWTARPVDRDDATGVELSTRFEDPAELGARVEALTAGLAEDDGALLREVELRRDEEGGYVFVAEAGLDPPRILGTLPLSGPASEAGAGGGEAATSFDGDDLGELLATSGDRFAVAELRVHMPTVPEAPGATVRGTTATWELPVDGLRRVTATAPPVPVRNDTALVVAAVAGGALVVVFAVRALGRRR